MITFDTSDVLALAAELPKLGVKGERAMRPVFKAGAEQIERTWRENAEETSGEHGKHYPNAIDHEPLLGTSIGYEIGPNPSKRQGGMRFEEGGPKQPPHLDGQRAADVEIPRIDRNVQTALTLLGL